MPELDNPSAGPLNQAGAQPLDEAQRQHSIARLLRFLLVALIVTLGVNSWLYLESGAWQLLTMTIVSAVVALAAVIALLALNRGRRNATGWIMVAGTMLLFGSGELVISGATGYFLAFGILSLVVICEVTWPQSWPRWFASGGLLFLFVLIVYLAQPVPRHSISESSLLSLFVPIVLMIAMGMLTWELTRSTRTTTIQSRLLLSFIWVALFPAVIISASSLFISSQGAARQAESQLSSVASLKAIEIESWLSKLEAELAGTLKVQDIEWRLIKMITTPEDETDPITGNLNISIVRTYLNETSRSSALFDNYYLINARGEILLSSMAELEGTVVNERNYLQEGLRGTYFQYPFSSTDALGAEQSLGVAIPVQDEDRIVGVLVGHAPIAGLQAIMADRSNLVQGGDVFLVGSTGRLISSSTAIEELAPDSPGSNLAIETQSSGSGTYINNRGDEVIGAYRWIPALRSTLLAEQARSTALRSQYLTTIVNIAIGLTSVLLAAAAAIFITRDIASPLTELAATASEIADGNLTLTAPVESIDEMGQLAQAFNSMTTQLRTLIGELEQRVEERTLALEERSRFLEAAGKVSQAATSILNPDQLIAESVELIRQQFDLYYVGLFLIEPDGEWAKLKAGTGSAGRAMMRRGHRIKIGEGMIGWSLAHSENRIALRAKEDSVRLIPSELPDTQSEAAIPLISRGKIMGALTVQDTRQDAFSPDSIAVLQTMADQIAVALDNAQLFKESQIALEAERRTFGQMSRAAWQKILQEQAEMGFRSDDRGISPAYGVWHEEMAKAVASKQPVLAAGKASGPQKTVAIPIKVRDEVIAVLDTYKEENSGQWTSDELDLLETFADQLGMALENARLYQETQLRAERQRVIGQVSNQIRSAGDMDDILRTAVREIRRALGASHGAIRLGTESHLRSPKGHAQPDRADRTDINQTGSEKEGRGS